jgi:hypothetical protein
MPVIQFESTIEGNLIRIPERYMEQIPARVTVTLIDVENPKLEPKMFNDRQNHRAAFEEFFTAMAEIDDEPIDGEFDAILVKRVNITRELDL